MSGKLEQIETTFGQVLPEAPFYAFPIALRFELSGDAQGWPDRILRGYTRAKTVISALPEPADGWDIIVESWPTDEGGHAQMFDQDVLELYGAKGSTITHLGHAKRGHDEYRNFYQATPSLSVDACLFGALSSGNPSLVSPLHGHVYLINWEQEVIVHPYDDQGMDVVATSPAPLLRLYREFGDWLLDYDRKRMDETFTSLG